MLVFILAVIATLGITIYQYLRSQTPAVTASAVSREQIKKIILQVVQIVGVLTSIGWFGSFGFLTELSEVLGFVAENFDSVWEHGLAIITFLIALFAKFKTERPDAVERVGGSARAGSKAL